MGSQSKAIAGGIGAALSQILVWLIELFAPAASDGTPFDIPDTIEAAIAVIVCYAVVWIAPANTPPADSGVSGARVQASPWSTVGAVLLALLMLGACTPMTQAAVDATMAQAEMGYKAAHDREALVLKQAPCIMSVGGYVRMLNEAEQGAVMTLCGGEQGMTLADLLRLGNAVQALERASGRTLADMAVTSEPVLPPEPIE